MRTRRWLGVCAGLCSAALAGQPPVAPAPGAGTPRFPPSVAPAQAAPPAAAPAPADDDFIEFLGADDVGDAAWWEFLKRSAPGEDPPKPAAPPQDARS